MGGRIRIISISSNRRRGDEKEEEEEEEANNRGTKWRSRTRENTPKQKTKYLGKEKRDEDD
jgi:hypothetical protein